jgi:hypothetical protein
LSEVETEQDNAAVAVIAAVAAVVLSEAALHYKIRIEKMKGKDCVLIQY